MPYPKKGEEKEHYISRCIPYIIKEKGVESDQAAAICYSMWRKNEDIDIIGKYMNEGKDRYEVSNKDMKKGYWKVIDTETGLTKESGFSTKSGAKFAADNLNKKGRK